MHVHFDRRAFLRRAGLALGSAATLATLPRLHAFAAAGTGLTPPVVDHLAIRVVLDTSHDIFISGDQHPMVKIERTRQIIGKEPNGVTLGGQWGLSLYLESTRGAEMHRYLLDFGFTPDVLNRNLDLLAVDPKTLDGLIVSHGHLDHYGGLMGFLLKHRKSMRPDLRLYAGGETNFCYTLAKPNPQAEPVVFGILDRRKLAAEKVQTVLCEEPHIVADAFTSGNIDRSSFERVLPNTLVEVGTHGGAGCNAAHFTDAERQGKIVPDLHHDEHATCFMLKDRGLVVITSCGHAGLVNTVQTAMRVAGVNKVHAVIGGFHLAPAPKDYLMQEIAALKQLNPDVVVPMHCAGANFIAAMQAEMPDKLVLSSVGSRFTLGA